ncbi:uncharacterized protein PG998_011283 [Apiospora kogelbergensis]|uniref:Stc1 domain-containing protein n=1 Tax=Apiospora kogelbergensis TaxID=1337665 RepID=A0AAW0RC16_9PEZI
MAKGARLYTKPQRYQKNTEPADQSDQSDQSRAQATDGSQDSTANPYTRLINAERECHNKFACWNCLTLKGLFEFEPDQIIKIRRMDLPDRPVQTLRRVCFDCGISIGLYRPGDVMARSQTKADCWVCDCPRAHDKTDNLIGDQCIQCDDCGMAQPFSTPDNTQNRLTDIVSIFPLRRAKRFVTVPDTTEQVRKTSIPFLLCSTPTPDPLSPSYQYSDMASEFEAGSWSSGQ